MSTIQVRILVGQLRSIASETTQQNLAKGLEATGFESLAFGNDCSADGRGPLHERFYRSPSVQDRTGREHAEFIKPREIRHDKRQQIRESLSRHHSNEPGVMGRLAPT